MKKIIGIISPFDIKQNFYVYEDGNKIDTISTTIKDISKDIFLLVEKYNIYKIDLSGSKQYNRGLKKQIQKAEMNKFNENKLEINII